MDRVSLNPAALNKWLETAQANRAAATSKADKSETKSFTTLLTESLSNVNRTQTEADTNVAEYLSGKGGLHETMIALEKADISLRLVVQVRNKAVEAYKEIMRMQV
jgi:flagellar hook-basal body complex protein FliE